jgi:hypothetical protein
MDRTMEDLEWKIAILKAQRNLALMCAGWWLFLAILWMQ